MINPVGDATLAYTFSSAAKSASRDTSDASEPKTGDVVSISADALKAQLENTATGAIDAGQADSGDSGSRWWLTSWLEQGSFTLKNGNEQKISIEGNKLEILEFKDGKLVKSVEGTITGDGATLNTEYYDPSGEIFQSIQTEITELKGEGGWSTASMTRSAQWFEDGKLKGEIQDSMLLNTKNRGLDKEGEDGAGYIRSLLEEGTDKVVPSVEALTGMITLEEHIASYHADVREYGLNGRVSREISIDHEGRYEQLSNRAYEDIGNLPARTTREKSHNTDFAVTIRDYDENGDLMRDASLRDLQKDEADKEADGRMNQSLSVSWYNKGELIKQSYGSLGMEETPWSKLPNRPGILDTLGLSAEGYLGDEPQSAVDLLNRQFLQSSSEPEFFMDSVNSLAGKGAYNTAEGVAEYGSPEQPYAIDWTDEIYRDGEMVMRKRDVESARETSPVVRDKAVQFRTGHGLTENDAPLLVREARHELERFEDGDLKSRQTMRARETVDPDLEGGSKLVTSAFVTQGLEGEETTTAVRVEGPLSEVDPDPNQAAKGLAGQVELTLDGMRETTGNMNRGVVSRREALHVRFNYKHVWD